MTAWDVDLYLKFSSERTQPAIDLVSRVNLANPARIVDVGCGPGNSTAILRQRWPNARVAGLDNSPDMIGAARLSDPEQEWILADAGAWQADAPCDLVFSNAALQWVPDHERLIPRLFGQAAPGGALAFQVPARAYSQIHQLILEVANEPEWAQPMDAARQGFTQERAGFYYDLLSDKAARLDIWKTAWAMAVHRPLTGSGFMGPYVEEVVRRFRGLGGELLFGRLQCDQPMEHRFRGVDHDH